MGRPKKFSVQNPAFCQWKHTVELAEWKYLYNAKLNENIGSYKMRMHV